LKSIGLIGGMIWKSTAPYYRQINETVRGRLGGLLSARVILYNVDFHEIEPCSTRATGKLREPRLLTLHERLKLPAPIRFRVEKG
jgi:aspartate/glutamate racemase